MSEENLVSTETLQEKEKTYFTFTVSQWNQNFFQVILGRFFLSIPHEIYIQYKIKTEKRQKMEIQGFVSDSSDIKDPF